MVSVIKTKVLQYHSKYITRKTIDKGLFFSDGRENIGDSMVPWLVEQVSGCALPFSNPRDTRGPHLFAIGSILQYADKDSYIWGSGFISKSSKIHGIPAAVYAVRGPLTAKRLNELTGLECSTFCDPALLTPRFIQPTVELATTKIGLIPHYVDKIKLGKTKIVNSGSVILCDVETANVQKFINQICSCEIVISSSLHGIILAEAFGIPAIWAKFDDDIYGKDFKFYDYYQSTGRNDVIPACFYRVIEADLVNIVKLKTEVVKNMGDALIESYPDAFK